MPRLKYMVNLEKYGKKYKWVNINMQWLLVNFKTSQNAIYIIRVL